MHKRNMYTNIHTSLIVVKNENRLSLHQSINKNVWSNPKRRTLFINNRIEVPIYSTTWISLGNTMLSKEDQ